MMGVMPTVEEILAKCEPYGECMLWTGGLVHGGGQPRIWVDRKPMSGRRIVFVQARGEIIEGMRIGLQCGERLCLNPEHLRQMTCSELHKDNYRRRGGLAPSHKAACTASARRRSNNTMNMDIARAIRYSNDSASVLAARYDLAKSTVYKVLRNERWAEHTRGASIFSMRPLEIPYK